MENTKYKQTTPIKKYPLFALEKKSEFIQNHRDIHEFNTIFDPDDSGAATLSSILRRLTHEKNRVEAPVNSRTIEGKMSQRFSADSIPGKKGKSLIL